MKVHEKTIEIYNCLKCPNSFTGGGGLKLCQTQPGMKLDLLWSDSLRKLSGSMHVLAWTTCLHLCSKFVELL